MSLVPYDAGGSTGLEAPISSSPATPSYGTSVPGPNLEPGRRPNWGAIAFLSLLAIAAITLWRIHTGQASGTKVKTIWNAIILMLIVSLTWDLDSGLGAAFGGSIVMFMLLRHTNIASAFQARSASPGVDTATPSLPHGQSAAAGASDCKPPNVYSPVYGCMNAGISVN